MQMMKIDEIVVKSPYLRTKTDVDALIKSIKTIGLIHPLTLNDKNELIAGGRRYHAMKELGFDEVPVTIVTKEPLLQELISIDENLVRKPLNKLEFEQCLNRGREIYEKLNPTANKVDIEKEAQTPAEKKQEREEEENDETSFAAVTAEKLGVSKAVIKKAIKRDAKSSKTVKEARGAGEVSASQVNEIIRLTPEEQDKILPHIKDKSVREVRKFIEKAKVDGLEYAIEAQANEKHLPKEFTQLNVQIKKCNKMMSKLVMENIDVDHPDMKKILDNVKSLQDLTYSFENTYSALGNLESNDDYDSDEAIH